MNEYASYPINLTWKQQAEALFFADHLGISEIAVIIRRTRQTVSAYLSGLEGFNDEMENRKANTKAKRKEYQRQWDRTNRPSGDMHRITAESLKQEHETAVRILSAEKY